MSLARTTASPLPPPAHAAAKSRPMNLVRWRVLTLPTMQALVALAAVLAACLVVPLAFVRDTAEALLPTLFVCALCPLVLRWFVSASRVPSEDFRWLTALCVTGYCLRVAFAAFVYYGPFDYTLFSEDQPGYDHIPNFILGSWTEGAALPDDLQASSFRSRIGYYNFVALQYFVFGSSYAVPRFINCLCGGLTVLYTYLIGLELFDRLTAKIAAVFVTFFPAMILWSSLNLRDIWLTLAILIIFLHAVRLRQRFSLASVCWVFAMLAWLEYNRFYLVVVMAFVVLGVLMTRQRHLDKQVAVLFIFVAVLGVLHATLGLADAGLEVLNVERVNAYRKTLAAESVSESGYYFELDFSNPLVLALYLLIGIIYFFFSPFPWQITSLRALVVLPEMVIWYGLVPSVFMAVVAIIRAKSIRARPLLVPVLIVSLAYVFSTGNVGQAYRYRGQLIAFFLLLAAEGVVLRKVTAASRQRRQAGAAARRLAPGAPGGSLSLPTTQGGPGA